MDEGRAPVQLLIISEDQDTIMRIRGALVAASDVVIGGQCTSIDAARRHLAMDSPDIVLLDLRLPESLSLLESLAESHPTTAPIVLLPAEQMEQLQQAMLAGARGFSLIPLSGDELLTTVRQVYTAELEKRQRQLAEAAPSAVAAPVACSRVIAVCGIKGGIGRSVIAINLAIALAQESHEPVALVEGHASLGDIALLLNVHPPHTLVDLVTEPRELDTDLMRGALVSHASGIKVLFAARTMEDAARMTPELLAAALSQLRRLARYVVVDTDPMANDVLGEVLTSADVVLVVTTPEVPSLRRTMLLLQAVQAETFFGEKLRLVLNREGLTGGISHADIAHRLGIPIAIALPDDPALVAYSVNRGVPLMLSHPKSLLARRIRELARQLLLTAQPDVMHRGMKLPLRGIAIRLPAHLPKPLRLRRVW